MILDDICEQKRVEVDAAIAALPLPDMREAAESAKPARNFRDALRAEGMSLIAEVKHASPSKGVLVQNFEPTDLASQYEQAGAAAVSVLTDEKFFMGSLSDLVSVRRCIDLPCLRKEFIIDPYQIYESRAASADAILLIVRILSDAQINEYQDLAQSLGMGVLVETHDAEEIERALNADAHIIGINNRDLSTFEVDFRRTLELKKLVPGGKVLVSESGIHTAEDVRALENGGVDAILVGESLLTSENVSAKIRELMPSYES